ncbi:MAG: hypothetical protein EP338_07705 [Bacteroidetes bacterium]|nr:MAG: hypothetical protein EP338_07705 [Bacteroidota bacterium]
MHQPKQITYSGTYMEFEVIDNVILASYHSNLYISLEVARKSVVERLEFTGDQVVPLLVDGTEVKGISKEARDYFGSEEGSQGLSASAIYTTSKLSAFLANFLIKVNLSKTLIPVRLFTDKSKAIEWLKDYV